jgi:UDP-N-acetylglucosamine transferase subunit ALG13
MIFVTVGTDQPFERMIKIIDNWARENQRTDVFAQIGESANPPAYIQYSRLLEPPEFAKKLAEADLIIAHAGMGTILSALRYGKPILVFPRRASLGEQRNEHQLATARHLSALGKVNVAFDDDALRDKLAHLDSLVPKTPIGASASESLVTAIRQFIALE